MEQLRKPLQGVTNIIRFNWHFYIVAILFFCTFYFLGFIQKNDYSFWFQIIFMIGIFVTISSLLVSLYIYDLSNLYQFTWMNFKNKELNILNINAGFDETSAIIQHQFPKSKFLVLDFYNPKKHTEISIKRARKAYPSFPDTITISTDKIDLKDNFADVIFLIFSAHEIRDNQERVVFFKELNRLLTKNGKIYVLEHLRDFPNFLAYNIGFFHFLSHKDWLKTFDASKLILIKKQKINFFVSLYILQKNGVTP